MSTATIIVGFVVSTLGFSFFIYGKKQGRLPQLVAGILLMISPYMTPSPGWMAGVGVAVAAALWGSLRAGW